MKCFVIRAALNLLLVVIMQFKTIFYFWYRQQYKNQVWLIKTTAAQNVNFEKKSVIVVCLYTVTTTTLVYSDQLYFFFEIRNPERGSGFIWHSWEMYAYHFYQTSLWTILNLTYVCGIRYKAIHVSSRFS